YVPGRLPEVQARGTFTFKVGTTIYYAEVVIRLHDFDVIAPGQPDPKHLGYSDFSDEIKNTVGLSATNKPLEVYRVQQRLRYLGFPAWDFEKISTSEPDGTEVGVGTDGNEVWHIDDGTAWVYRLNRDWIPDGKVELHDDGGIDTSDFIEALKLFQAVV